MTDDREQFEVEIFANDRAVRVINLLAQYGMRKDQCAHLLRVVAEWYQPQGMRTCETCGDPFKPRRRKRHCSRACRQAAYRKRNGA